MLMRQSAAAFIRGQESDEALKYLQPTLQSTLASMDEANVKDGMVFEFTGSDGLPLKSIRDRHGNWTYGFCVVVDDHRQGVDLVVRGRDLLHATRERQRVRRDLADAAGLSFFGSAGFHKGHNHDFPD